MGALWFFLEEGKMGIDVCLILFSFQFVSDCNCTH